MPPKDSKKSKVKAEPETPQKTKAKPADKTEKAEKVKDEPEPEETPKKTPSRKNTSPTFTLLAATAPTPVDVSFEGESGHASMRKGGNYGQLLKLSAEQQFSIKATRMITEGEDTGCQIIVLRPAKAFDFAKLPEEVRNRIYRYYFAPKGIVNSDIVLDGKRANKEPYAKTYAQGSKNRVGLLTINKETFSEAVKVFYAHTIKFDSTATLIDFLSEIERQVFARLHSLTIKNYNKATARNAMHFLSDGKNIQKLRFESGVFAEGDPKKAAKAIHGDMYKFLEAIGSVDVLQFGKDALTLKDKKETKSWSEDMVNELKEELAAKLKK